MAKPDWLSIDEISRLWSEETGLDAEDFKQDLEAWFADFIKQSPAKQSQITGRSGENTNRLMGMLGAHYLERPTFAAYCEERGHPKPQFWFGVRQVAPPPEPPRQAAPAAAPEDEPEASDDAVPEERPEPARAAEKKAAKPAPQIDPDLAAFQSQIADLSARLEAPSFELPVAGKAAETERTDREQKPARPEPTERAKPVRAEPPRPAQRPEPLPEPDDPWSEDLDDEDFEAERRVSMGEAYSAPLQSTAAAVQAPTPRRPSPPRGQTMRQPANYQDPNAIGQFLRGSTPQPKSHRKLMVAGGVALPVLALVIWGAVSVMQSADQPQSPAMAELSNPSVVQSQADSAWLSAEPNAGTRQTGVAVPQDLAAARAEIARLSAAVAASDTVVARLMDELALARQAVQSARVTADVGGPSQGALQQELETSAETANLRAVLAAAKEKNAALGSQLQAALSANQDAGTVAADARAETARLRRENLVLSDRLETAMKDGASLRTALNQAQTQTEIDRQDLILAATASSARIAVLQRDLVAAQQEIDELNRAHSSSDSDVAELRAALRRAEQQTESVRQELAQTANASSARLAALQNELRVAQERIADLSKAAEAAETEAAKLRQALRARQQETAAARPSAAQSAEAGAPEPDEPESEPVQTVGVSNAPSAASSGFEQVAALGPSDIGPQTDAIPDSVTPDDLLLEPSSHLGRPVIVTGPVVWMLWRYRLQSDSGTHSMVVDVEGIEPADQAELRAAIDRVGVLGQVQARIRGTLVHQGGESYRLSASELALVE